MLDSPPDMRGGEPIVGFETVAMMTIGAVPDLNSSWPWGVGFVPSTPVLLQPMDNLSL
jgi:hypothetical protein